MAQMGAVAIRYNVAAYLQQLRGGLGDNQRNGSHRREQGFLFCQLGKLKASTRSLYDASWRSHRAKDKTWGECGEYGKEGRFAEKGGQQVGSVFQCSTDNEKIKAIYGNFGFWSWLRYWHLDSADYVLMMLMDKGYYDYDYEAVKEKPVLTAEDREIWSQEKLHAILGVKPKKKTLTPEELQAEVMAENKKKK